MYPRIRSLREDSDLNQTELAHLLQMSQTGYSKYETGENDIPTSVLIILAFIYNTSIDYLLNITDQKTPPQRSTKKAAHLKRYRTEYLQMVEKKRESRGMTKK